MQSTDPKPWMYAQLDHCCKPISNTTKYRRPPLTGIEREELSEQREIEDLETLYNRSGAYVGKENL